MILDPTSNIGKVRLRVGDYSDLPYFPDDVYLSVIQDNNGNLPKAATTMATYILAMLTHETHQKLAQIEVWGAEAFQNYMAFVKGVILNPNLSSIAPIPYTPVTVDEFGCPVEVPLIQFQRDWNKNYANGTQSQQLHFDAQFQNNFLGTVGF